MSKAAYSSPLESGDFRRSGPFLLSSLASGHSLFHWFLQSFIVILPEVQTAFQLSGVGVGAILTARELASGLVTLPGGVIVDLLQRHWGKLLAGCIGVFSLSALLMGLSPVYPLIVVGMGAVAIFKCRLRHSTAQTAIARMAPSGWRLPRRVVLN